MRDYIPEYGWDTHDPNAANQYTWPVIRRLLPSAGGLRILDVGCGNGWVSGQLASLGHIVTAIDTSSKGIELARRAYPDVSFKLASVYDALDVLSSGSFDVVVSSEVIEHLYLPRCLLDSSFKLLVPGGSIIVTTPYHGYLKNLAISLAGKWDAHFTVGWDGGHIKFFSERTIRAMLLEAGFAECVFSNVGRLPALWKSMVVRAKKPEQ